MLFDCRMFIVCLLKWRNILVLLKYYTLQNPFVPRLADDFLMHMVSSTNQNVTGGTTLKSREEFADAIVLSAMTAFLDMTSASFSVRYKYSWLSHYERRIMT